MCVFDFFSPFHFTSLSTQTRLPGTKFIMNHYISTAHRRFLRHQRSFPSHRRHAHRAWRRGRSSDTLHPYWLLPSRSPLHLFFFFFSFYFFVSLDVRLSSRLLASSRIIAPDVVVSFAFVFVFFVWFFFFSVFISIFLSLT